MCQKYCICKLSYDTVCHTHMHIVILKIGIHIHCRLWKHAGPPGQNISTEDTNRKKCGNLSSSTEWALCERMSRRSGVQCVSHFHNPSVKPCSASFSTVLSMQDFCIICLSYKACRHVLPTLGGGGQDQAETHLYPVAYGLRLVQHQISRHLNLSAVSTKRIVQACHG